MLLAATATATTALLPLLTHYRGLDSTRSVRESKRFDFRLRRPASHEVVSFGVISRVRYRTRLICHLLCLCRDKSRTAVAVSHLRAARTRQCFARSKPRLTNLRCCHRLADRSRVGVEFEFARREWVRRPCAPSATVNRKDNTIDRNNRTSIN